MNSVSTKARLAALCLEINELQSILGEGEDAEKIISRHIKRLHQYNESKDATQILIARLATLKEMTVRQIHKDYDLAPND